MAKIKIAIACPSGGIRAAVFGGALKALEEEFEFSAIISNSGGAVFSACYLLNIDIGSLANTNPFLNSFKYVLPKEKLFAKFTDIKIEDLRVPLFIQSTNFDNLTPVIFESGSLKDALNASSNHNIYKPVKIGDTNYIDGGVTSGYGIDYLRKKGYTNILALQTGFPNFAKLKMPYKPVSKWVAAVTRMNLLRDLEIHPADYVIDDMATNYSIYDFDKTAEMFDQGYAIIRQHLPKIAKVFN